jgi:hypothetical protein
VPEWFRQLSEEGGPRAKVAAYLVVIILMSLVIVIDGLVHHVRGEWTAAMVALLAAVALAGGRAVER